jgi:hypothetical protein
MQNGNAKWYPSWTMNRNQFFTAQWNKELSKNHAVSAMAGTE